ncbi:MAG TPA: hypothetical protein VHN98_05040, partial [Acidimicrobiales bacterium]|nr:hypothetical protein [Acidimicrobiales bacterium]
PAGVEAPTEVVAAAPVEPAGLDAPTEAVAAVPGPAGTPTESVSLLGALSAIDEPAEVGDADVAGVVGGDDVDELDDDGEDEKPKRRIGVLTKAIVVAALWILLVVFLTGRFRSDNSTPASKTRLDQATQGSGDSTVDAGGGDSSSGGTDGNAVSEGDASTRSGGSATGSDQATAAGDSGSGSGSGSGTGTGGTSGGTSGGSTSGSGGGTSGEARPGFLPVGTTTTTAKSGGTTTTGGGGGSATTTTTSAGGGGGGTTTTTIPCSGTRSVTVKSSGSFDPGTIATVPDHYCIDFVNGSSSHAWKLSDRDHPAVDLAPSATLRYMFFTGLTNIDLIDPSNDHVRDTLKVTAT